MTARSPLFALAAALLITGCGSTPEPAAEPQAISLLGEALYIAELDDARRAALEDNLAEAQRQLAAQPESEAARIWAGRREAYLGDYVAAIEIYTEGLEQHPFSYRLLRHRGHRWISLRDFERAIDDLTVAAARAESFADEIEADGAPNALGIPTGTDKTSIYYHLGLAHYLRGEYAAALAAYDLCRSFSGNDDTDVAADYWRYLILRRLGRDAEAAVLAATITRDMNVIENFQYHDLLLFFGGRLDEHTLLTRLEGGIGTPTLLYGLGTWHLLEGRPERAAAIYRQILDGDVWQAFGAIAAESEMARDTTRD